MYKIITFSMQFLLIFAAVLFFELDT